jgi:hypothetical protein
MFLGQDKNNSKFNKNSNMISKFVFHLKISSCKLGLVKQSKKLGARNDTP